MKNFNFSLKNLFIYLLFFSLLVITINIVQAIGYDEITFIPINSRLVACEENYQGNASRIDTCTNAAMLYQILNSNLVSQGVTISQTQQLCETLTSATYRNSCFNLMSQQMNSIELCGNISTSGGENNCLSNFLYRQDDISDISSYCSGLGDYISLNDCQDILYSKLAFESDNSEYCLNIIDSEYKNGCFSELGYYCGDGICTYGFESSSSCLADCVGTSFCGNSYLDENEYCDDGNFDNSDGCNSDCEIEEGWDCLGDLGGLSVCNEICSDGYIVGEEVCDQVEPLPCETEDGYTGEYYCNSECSGFTTCNTGEFCGDGVVNGSESCDDEGTADGDGCNSSCEVEEGWYCSENAQGWSACNEICGDGDIVGEEVCDQVESLPCETEDGYTGEYYCNSECSGFTTCNTGEFCGDGVVNSDNEECDDGNENNNDGCSSTCAVEEGWDCLENAQGWSACNEICGDGDIVGEEVCDDGYNNGEYGYCELGCREWAPRCGDDTVTTPPEVCEQNQGFSSCILDSGYAGNQDCNSDCLGFTPCIATEWCGDGDNDVPEQCDDGDTDNGDGCSSICTVETGWICSDDEPSICEEVCGDGDIVGEEVCDDGDIDNGDGCSSQCVIEEGWSCSGEPSECEETCGNGSLDAGEGCDDGNLIDNDGCNSQCVVEENWSCSGQPSTCVCDNGSEYCALVALFIDTNGPVWNSKTNWLSSLPLGQWQGITVNGNNSVIGISLPNNNLNGSIPVEIGDLDYLNTLNLNNNYISDISGLAFLSNLNTLDLSDNNISNIDNLSNLVNLGILNLQNNNISDISGLSGLANLSTLDLRNNILGESSCLAIQLLVDDNLLSFDFDPQDSGFNYFSDCPENCNDGYIWGDEECEPEGLERTGGLSNQSRLTDDPSDHFGRAVAIDGNYMVIGTEDNKAYVFDNLGGEWAIATSISYGSSSDHFGRAVAIDGNYMVIGAENNNHFGSSSNAGAAYIFDNLGGEWAIATSTYYGSIGDHFGSSVAIDGNYMVIGAYGDNNTVGAAYVFDNLGGEWVFQEKLTNPNSSYSWFGISVAIDGNYMVIGAHLDGNSEGAAYVFHLTETGWNQEAKLIAYPREENSYFGKTVAINGDYVVIGAYKNDDGATNDVGAAYIFKKPAGGWNGTTTSTTKFNPNGITLGASDYFGKAVAIDGNYMLIGAYGDDDDGSNAGAAYVFNNLGGEWEFQDQGKLTATFYYGFSGDHFGSSVAIDGNYMLIGADEYNGDTGRVYVFENECFSSVCNSSCRWQCQ